MFRNKWSLNLGLSLIIFIVVFRKEERAIKKLPSLIQNRTQQECRESAREQRMKFEDLKSEHNSLTVLVAHCKISSEMRDFFWLRRVLLTDVGACIIK